MPSIQADQIDIHYEDRGMGTPVVLIHGAASSSVCLNSLMGALAAPGLRLLAPDLRGMGRSSRITAMAPSGWNDDIRTLFDALDLEQVHLCGTSLGARIALRAALDMPDRISTLTLDALILHDSPRGGQLLDHIFGAEAPPEMIENLAQWNGADGREVAETYLRLRRTPGLQEHYDLRGAVGELRCPVLLCRGDLDDEIHPLAHTLEAYRAIQDARLWIAPATSFSAMRFQPADAARHILALTKTRHA